jgi:CRP-like cAMP-binding protein
VVIDGYLPKRNKYRADPGIVRLYRTNSEKPLSDSNPQLDYIELERGGYLVDTSIGYVQFGSPPETIKDTMKMEKGVPAIFVLPARFFHRDKGISCAELEFPLYYNFFLRKKKTSIVCHESDISKFKIVLNESVFGPEIINLVSEYDDFTKPEYIPDIKAEMDYFRHGLQLDDLVEFVPFKSNSTRIDSVTISILGNENFQLEDSKQNLSVEVPGEIDYTIMFGLGSTLPDPFIPPVLGVTCLGPSHGFDPIDNTSGFLVWINNRGIMVDPPVNSTEWLKKSNVDPKYIDSIILTHTHADHDAGTFQKILEEEIVTIYSTETVMDSFLRKYSNLTGIETKELIDLFNFEPLIIGRSTNINGATFIFNYTLHSIPTIGFKFFYRDKSFVYSSDHQNDPEVFDKLEETGIINAWRKKSLLDFPWHYDYIYHEAGVPPLHTRIDYLDTLPDDIKSKITCYHIASKDFPENSLLSRAEFGIGQTLIMPVKTSSYEDAYRLLDILGRVDIFKDFTMEQAKNLLAVVQEETLRAGEQLIKKGSYGDKIYIILSGTLYIDIPGDKTGIKKRFSPYDYIGEASLILNKPRTADVYAETDVKLLTIKKSPFLHLIENSNIEEMLKKVALNRDEDSWQALSATRLFSKLTDSQKTALEAMLERVEITSDMKLIKKNSVMDTIYIFHSGSANIRDYKKNHVWSPRMGEFVGSFYELQKNLHSSVQCTAKKGSLLFKLKGSDFRPFIKKNPGLYMRFFEEEFRR